jgi:glycosyltransferase involved in cell wall biosynthesis
MTVLKFTGVDELAEEEFSLNAREEGVGEDGTYDGAKGGTEMMRDKLRERVDNSLIEEFNWFHSRITTDVPKDSILWLHDMWDDPQVQHLKEETSRKRFDKLIFVSNWQQWCYVMGLGIPYQEGIVMQNAIEPIDAPTPRPKKDVIRMIYHTTPHRGLDILTPVFRKLTELTKDDMELHLDVYSSFQIYGPKYGERDVDFKPVFDDLKDQDNVTYHGYQPNEVVREALKEAHIYAYPNTWPETSCISVMEAMSAGCAIVCPNFAALPETTGNWANMYPFHENKEWHANMFLNVLMGITKNLWDDTFQNKLSHAKMWTDNFYNWDLRAAQWTGLLKGMIDSRSS